MYPFKIMKVKTHPENIEALLKANGLARPSEIKALPASGSARVYFRIFFQAENQPSLIGAYNPITAENIAQYSFTHHFLEKGLAVPRIYFRDETYAYLILEDLGDETLFQRIQQGENDQLFALFKQVVDQLLRFQLDGIQGLDLDVAYPVQEFNRRAIMWDLNYFKYYFVKAHDLAFDENALEDEFERFADLLLASECTSFNYRDFQSRNIMIRNESPWFIDFQGGRKGPLAYDLVSLLFQAKANLSPAFRARVLKYYVRQLDKRLPGKSGDFLKHYPTFIYFRLMQVLGAYGYRGLVQRKAHFLQSIPFAVNNLTSLLQSSPLAVRLPQLEQILQTISQDLHYEPLTLPEGRLRVSINSFSYKKSGIPLDLTENGGGFTFDCRALPNPGRIHSLKVYNGREQPIIDYLKNKAEVGNFLSGVYEIVNISLENYLSRNFNHLQVNFGCTGGQHRSVYCAEAFAGYLRLTRPEIEVQLTHHEQKTWPV